MMHPIIRKIEEFIDKPRLLAAGYTFDHIVLGDLNLGDEDIRYCLSNESILSWLERQISYYKEGLGVADSLYWYTLIIEAAEIASFLHELWRMPIEERRVAVNSL